MTRRNRGPCVVDTNVAMVANGKSTAGAACTAECAKELSDVMNRGHVVIDDALLILNEYRANLNSAGQPGVGDRFYRWLLVNQFNVERCTRVRVTSTTGGFAEFPVHEDLVSFDPSDRKFIAVAVAHPDKPCILQAFDSKWWPLRDVFSGCGVTIAFLCPKEIKAKYEEKCGC